MVVVPCSSNTLAEVAHGLGDNLISRAAAVTLKERRRLVMVHREMPLSPIDVNNYKALSDAGVILASANPGFYLNPTTVLEVVDFVAGKLLDLVGVQARAGHPVGPEGAAAADAGDVGGRGPPWTTSPPAAGAGPERAVPPGVASPHSGQRPALAQVVPAPAAQPAAGRGRADACVEGHAQPKSGQHRGGRRHRPARCGRMERVRVPAGGAPESPPWRATSVGPALGPAGKPSSDDEGLVQAGVNRRSAGARRRA
jgi:hypothetical protein